MKTWQTGNGRGLGIKVLNVDGSVFFFCGLFILCTLLLGKYGIYHAAMSKTISSCRDLSRSYMPRYSEFHQQSIVHHFVQANYFYQPQEFIYSSIFLHLLLAHDSRAELHDTSSSWANAENAGDPWRESTKGGTKKGEFSKQCWNIRKCMQAWDPSDQIDRKKQFIIHINMYIIYIYIQLPFSFAVLVRRSCQNLEWMKKVLVEAEQFWEKYRKEFNCLTVSLLYPSFLLVTQHDR